MISVVYSHGGDDHDHEHENENDHHDHEHEHEVNISNGEMWLYGLGSGIALGVLGLVVSAFFVLIHKFAHKYF